MNPLSIPKASRVIRTSFRNRIGLAGGITIFSVSTGHADEFWVGDTSADWNTAGNWTNDALPSGKWAVVNGGSPHVATISADSTFTPSDIAVGIRRNEAPHTSLNKHKARFPQRS